MTGAGVLIEWGEDLRAIVERAKQLPVSWLVGWQRVTSKHVAAGGQRFSFHDLRSVSADGAATAEEARDRLGHASVETTKRHYLRGLTRARPRK